jgi:glycosyltransferase involved in cell wall biosynthesis
MNNKKIKVLHILPSLNSGGAERLVLDLLNNFSPDKFSVELLLFKSKGFFYDEARAKGIKVIVLNKKFKLDLINFFKIYRRIKKISPDIVHTHLGADIYGSLAAKLAGVKFIVSTEHNVLQNNNKLLNFFKKIFSSFFVKIIAVSSTVKNDLINNLKLKENKVSLIYNGVDVSKFKIEDNIKNSDKIVFGSVGRLVPQKNYSLLIRALAQVKNRDYKCLIAGDGYLKDDLKKEIKSLGLEDNIELVGLKHNIANFLNQLDFFVLPSKWEGLGIVLLEAGLLKLPVLASKTDGIVDIVFENETGKFFVNDNLSDLVDKLNYFLDPQNKEQLKGWGENLYKMVVENFSIQKITKEYENLYLNLINNYEDTSS